LRVSVAARDATETFDHAHHSEDADEMKQAFFVGNYVDVSENYTHIFPGQ
jgi:E3 ubiquitin-protein ligase HERC2